MPHRLDLPVWRILVKQSHTALIVYPGARGDHVVPRGVPRVNAARELGLSEDANVHIHLLHSSQNPLPPKAFLGC